MALGANFSRIIMLFGRSVAKSRKFLEGNMVLHGSGREFLENYSAFSPHPKCGVLVFLAHRHSFLLHSSLLSLSLSLSHQVESIKVFP